MGIVLFTEVKDSVCWKHMDRRSIIAEMRKERKTYQEIADALGISRQRVHQIYKDYIPFRVWGFLHIPQ